MKDILARLGLSVLERGWLSSNIVLFPAVDGDGAALVDTGYDTHAAQTVAWVEGQLGEEPLARVLNTHLHSDHCGGNAALKHAYGATIHIPPGHAGAVARWDEDELTYRATGQQCDRFVHDGVIEPGSVLQMGGVKWRAYSAPGHDPHSLVLWAAEPRILISADALWSNGFGVIFPELEGESGFAEQRAMLHLIETLAPRLVIPGHGTPFTDVGAALRRAHARLDALSASLGRNARHAAKVLLKFYLLEVREVSMEALIAHVARARYYPLINDRYFRMPFDAFIRQQVRELVASGAAVMDDGTVRDMEG